MKAPAKLLSYALLLMATAALPACDDTTGTDNDDVETIEIGGLFSLTGNWSSLGVTSKAAMEIGIADVNAFLDAGNAGIQFKAVIEDTKLIPATALTAVTKFKADGVEAVIGPQSSAEVAAIQSYVNSNNILLISQSSTAGTLAVANDNIFRLTPSDTLEAVAIVALLKADNITTVIPFWRSDAGNVGLQVATRALFPGPGRTVKAGVEYSASAMSYTASVAALKAQVVAAIAERGGNTAGIAIMHAAFDEVVDIFVLASADPVLSSVRWYGTDGTALNEPLKANATASAFARLVGFSSPSPGTDEGARDRWQPIAARIQTRAGSQPDAFALAVYDAVWLIAQAYLVAGGEHDAADLKAGFVTAANNFYGASGWTRLNAAGDRAYGAFDFWALVRENPAAPPFWAIKAQYNTQTGQLTRLLQ